MESILEIFRAISDLFDSVTKLCVAAIVPLGIAAFINWLMRDGINKQVFAQDSRWRAERKETAFLECLKLLWASRCYYCHGLSYPGLADGIYINYKDFLGRMQTLRYVEPWLIVAASHSSAESREKMTREYDKIINIIDLIFQETPQELPSDKDEEGNNLSIVPGHGLPGQIDDTLDTVVECARKELAQVNHD